MGVPSYIWLRPNKTRREELDIRPPKDFDSVNETSYAHDEMWVDWELIEDLCEGRDRMIQQGRRWLPQEPLEEYQSYLTRLYRSFLFSGFADTLDSLAAKPFSREITIKNEENLPDPLKALKNDVDCKGTDLTTFIRLAFHTAMKYGHTLVHIEMPEVRANLTDKPLTLLEEQKYGIRPYWNHVEPPNLLGWRTKIIRGREVVTQARIKTTRSISRGAFGEERFEVIKVLVAPQGNTPGYTQEYYKVEDKWQKFGKPKPNTYPGIPLFWLPIKPKHTGIFESIPPFKTLAELNLEHWQKSSDLSNILRFVSIAMVLLTGMGSSDDIDDDESKTGGKGKVAWGVNNILYGELGADGKYIEHSGQGIGALSRAIDTIEDHMEMLGLQPLLADQARVTATAQQKDDSKVTSGIQSWIRTTETFVKQLYMASALYYPDRFTDYVEPFSGIDKDPEEVISFDIYNEFGLKVTKRDDGDLLLQAYKEGLLPEEVILHELKKRGFIGEDVSIKDIVDLLEKRKEEKQAMALEISNQASPQEESEETDAENDAGGVEE